jgi:hypothetical protein
MKLKLTKPQQRELENVARGGVGTRGSMVLSKVQRLADGTVRHTFKNDRPNRIFQVLSRLQSMGLIEVVGDFYVPTAAGIRALEEVRALAALLGREGVRE